MKAFAFSTGTLEPPALAAPLASARAGGFAAFEGRVRDENEGRRVVALEYEAYEALASAEGERIVAGALARHGALAARCVHRLGRLEIGDVAVWVGVAAIHRAEAFAACREIIDEVKHRLPIWKKEHYADGDSGWVNCESCANPPRHRPFDYSRQVALPEIGAAGQARLGRSSVVVIGAGGLGCAAAAALAGAGIGRLTLVDGDRVESSNLHRQPLYAMSDVGHPKAEAAARRLRDYNPDIDIRSVDDPLHAGNAGALLAGASVVLECTDRFAAKFQVNDAALAAGVPAVIASVYQYEGQLQVVRPGRGSCLRCVWPEATRDGLVGNCAEAGVIGPVPAVLGQLQAMEALKLLLDLPGQLRDEVLLVDLLAGGIRRLRVPPGDGCPHGRATAGGAEAARAVASGSPDLDVTLAAAAAAGLRIVDIREPEERLAEPLPLDGEALPLGRLLEDASRLHADGRYLLVCSHGVRSRAAAEWLRERGYCEVWSLSGGLAAQPR